MSFNLQQINNQKVKAIPLPYQVSKPIKGFDVCSEAYANIFCVAKKKSGKTSVIHHLMKECTNKKTNIIIFCSSIYKDKNWIAIRKWIEKRGNPHQFFTSIKEEGEDQIRNLVDDLTNEAKEREEKEDEPENKNNTDALLAYFEKHSDKKDEKVKAPKKDKYLTPEYFIVMDDLGDELHTPSLLKLLRENRHYLSKVVISSQYLNHLKPESRKQIDLFIIFKGMTEKKIEEIWKDADIGMPFDQFYAMYKKATKIKPNNKFPFFYVDTRENDFRRNFNTRIAMEPQTDEQDEE